MAIRENLIRLGLVVFSSTFAILVAELAVRASIWQSGRRAGHLEDSLEQSSRTPLGKAEDHPYSLRGLVRASPLPDVVYELKPGLAGTFRGRRLETNSHGLRDREYAREKDEGTCRIVGLGDSVMFGWGVGQDESYLEVLERRLGTDGPKSCRFEVLNFAVPGYNTAMEVAVFEHKALAYDPDLVVLHFVSNDLRLPHFMQAPADVLTWRRSYLLEWVRSRLSSHSPAPGSDDGLLDHGLDALPEEERQEVRRQYRHLAGEAGFRRAVQRLAELTRQRSIPVVVVRLAARHEHDELVQEAIGRHGFHSVTASRLFKDYLRESDLLSGDRGWREAFWVARRDSHPNALGHELYASALWDYLVAADLGRTTTEDPAGDSHEDHREARQAQDPAHGDGSGPPAG